MKKIVNFCGNCPFLYNENDVYDESVKHLCVLSKNLDLYFQYIDTVEGVFDENSTPDWCPLKKEEYTFSFKEFSNKRLNEIQNIKEKINEINEHIEYNDDNNADISKENDELIELNNELSNLQKNEEYYEDDDDEEDEEDDDDDDDDDDEDIESEINKTIDEIKNQMSYLEEASVKLQEMFNSLSE